MSVEYITIEDKGYIGYEVYEVENATEEISVRGNISSAGLFFKEKPIVFHWDDFSMGSIAKLLKGKEYQEQEYENILKKLRKLVNNEIILPQKSRQLKN